MSRNNQTLSVQFIGYTKEINLSEYSVSLFAKKNGMDKISRSFASEGLCGYWGKWRGEKGVKYTSYVMNNTQEIWELTPKSGKGNHILLNAPIKLLTE